MERLPGTGTKNNPFLRSFVHLIYRRHRFSEPTVSIAFVATCLDLVVSSFFADLAVAANENQLATKMVIYGLGESTVGLVRLFV